MDAAQFESIAISFYQGSAGEEARSTIQSICHDPTSLCLFHSFLFNTRSNEAKYLSLQILGLNILNGWAALPDSDRNKIKTDLLNLLIGWCSYIRLKGDNPDDTENKYFDVQVQLVHQLDNAIIQILLAEWPNGWPSFLHEFISVAKSHIDNVNENGEPTIYVFINAIFFMGQLSEQILTNPNVLSARKSELATALANNFQTIYSFIKLALSIDSPKVQIEGLTTLSIYFQWIDLKIIATDNIIENILGPIMNNMECRPFVLKCILSIVSRDLIYASPVIEQIFKLLIERVSGEISMLEDPNLIELFVRIFSKFVCLDQCALSNDIVIQWMIEYTKIVEDELLMEVVSMWHNLAKCYTLENQALPFSHDFLVPLQEVLCSKMCKPVEFGGDRNFYDDYSETLSLLIKMHSDDILHMMVDKIANLQFGSDESMNWIFSVGVVTGICDSRVESELMSAIFSIILRYSNPSGEGNSGENGGNVPNPALISMADAAFLYLAGQFTRYLNNNRQYFNLALGKIEESITGGQTASQLVALYSFKKIAIRCGKILISTEFAQKLFQQFTEIQQQLIPEFRLTLFEGTMNLVKSNPDKNQRDEMTLELFRRVDNIPVMTELISIVDEDSLPAMESMIQSMFGQFTSPEIDEQTKRNFYDLFIRFIDHFPTSSLLNDFVQLFLSDFGQLCSMINNSSADGNGTGTLVGISSAYAKSLSGFSSIIHAHNEVAKRFIEHQKQQQQEEEQKQQQQQGEEDENQHNRPEQQGQPTENDIKFENQNGPLLSNLFSSVIVQTFNIIKENMVDFPSLRQQFFTLVSAFCEDCSLLNPEMITDLLNFVFFGLKHPLPFLSEICLNTIMNVLDQFDKCEDESFATGFYETFYVPLLTNLLALFCDGLHNSLFSQITQAISHLLAIAASGKFSQLTQQSLTEIIFKKLQELFQDCKDDEIGLVANDIVNSIGNVGKLRGILSDFLISSKQIQITASPSMDDELVEHVDGQKQTEFEFLNEQNAGNQIMADNFVFPE